MCYITQAGKIEWCSTFADSVIAGLTRNPLRLAK